MVHKFIEVTELHIESLATCHAKWGSWRKANLSSTWSRAKREAIMKWERSIYQDGEHVHLRILRLRLMPRDSPQGEAGGSQEGTNK